MILLAIAVGAIIGGVLFRDFSGVVVGGLLGYMIAEVTQLKSRLASLESGSKQAATPPQAAGTVSPPTPPPAPVASARPPSATAATAPIAPLDVRPASPPRAQQGARSIEPNIEDVVFQRVKDFFLGGNTVVRIGIVVLFFGVAFFLKYAAEHARLPIELRLSLAAVAAIALLVLGAWLRKKREAYGLTLEGGAIGMLYLVVFAALRLYTLLPAAFAFALLVAICALAALLAIAQNSLALAVLGVTGGFLAPILASTGQGSHVMLFSYYAVLNLGILAISWFKAWRPLNLTGFAFTFVIGTAWGYRYYQPEFFGSVEPFLVFFFLLYVATVMLYAWRQAPSLANPVDGTLVFGVPIVAFLLQAAIVKAYPYGLAWSAFALAAFYLILASMVLKRASMRLLSEVFVALGMIFATLTIPLALDGHWTAAAWAIEGAGVLWIGLRQSQWLARAFGLLVQVGGGIFFFTHATPSADVAILNSTYVGVLLVALGGVTSGYLLFRYRERLKEFERPIGTIALAWGLVWFYAGTLNEIHLSVADAHEIFAWLLVVAAATMAQEEIGRRLAWPALRYAAGTNTVLVALTLASATVSVAHPFIGYGAIGWVLAFAAQYKVLRAHETTGLNVALGPRHALGFWVLGGLLAVEVAWAVDRLLPQSDWSLAAVAVVLSAMLTTPVALRGRAWPIRGNEPAYIFLAATLFAVAALVWLLQGLAQPGNAAPLTYVPVMNPLELASLILFLSLLSWVLAIRALGQKIEPLLVAYGAIAFIWLNAVLFRAIHHLADVPYTLNAMLGSVVAQSAISIFWSAIALAAMVMANRLTIRYLWLAGGALLAVVVIKLFLVDLSSTGAVERIVSFVGVGLLLLVIGYVAPVPPRVNKRAEVSP
jgi:uncharacterized membrane protein